MTIPVEYILNFIPLFQSFFFAFLLFTFRNKNALSNRVLGVFMLINFFAYLLSFLDIIKLYDYAIYSWYFTIPLMLAGNPVLFFYIRALTTENFKFKLYDILHFLPVLMVLFINLTTFGPLSYNDKILLVKGVFSAQNVSVSVYIKTYYWANIFYNIQVLGYSFFMILLLRKHKKNIENNFSFKEKISLGWLKGFIVIYIIFVLWEVLTYYLTFIKPYSSLYLVVVIVFYTFLGYFGLKQSDIYIVRNIENIPYPIIRHEHADIIKKADNCTIVNAEKSVTGAEVVQVPESEIRKKEIKIPLSKEKQKEIIEAINKLMEEEKLFLNSQLCLNDFAFRLKVNKNYISVLINEIYQKNFFNFVNEFRIKESQKLLLDPQYNNLSIEGIAISCGFNSKSVFNPAFKRYTGLTPTEYKKLTNKVKL
ncbi:MAG: hypothetical protein A2X08_02385 [Bacteroidetes bacterium GWA2_32_17]|nr:MAG: hypothetical protein A2X08_02385 [Bacteroidetes bacterium GWA2_32_17]